MESIGIPVKMYNMSCGPHQKFIECQRCEKTCGNLSPVCLDSCTAGCFCDEPYIKAPNGQCVELNDCPQGEVTVGVQDVAIEDCSSDEEFLSCGWCEPSCSEPEPQCAVVTCTRGCLCRPPLVRHYTGQCVERQDCLSQRCVDPNEEFVCRYGCEAHCDSRLCLTRPKRCTLGCHCKFGLLRDVTGQCVTADKCTQPLSVLSNSSSVIQSVEKFKSINDMPT